MKVKISKILCVLALMGILVIIVACNQTDNTAPASVNSPDTILPNPITEHSDSSNIGSNLTVGQAERDSVIKEEEVNKEVLTIKPECSVQPGRDASFIVTLEGKPVSNAKVFLSSLEIGGTDNAGRIAASIPYTSEITITAQKGDFAGELYVDLTDEFGA